MDGLKMENQNANFEDDSDNVISLDEYRKRIIPSVSEVEAALRNTILAAANPHEAEMAEALLEMYGTGLLDVRRDKDGEFLYSLKNTTETF